MKLSGGPNDIGSKFREEFSQSVMSQQTALIVRATARISRTLMALRLGGLLQ